MSSNGQTFDDDKPACSGPGSVQVTSKILATDIRQKYGAEKGRENQGETA